MAIATPVDQTDPIKDKPEPGRVSKPPMVIVELDEPQSSLAVKRMRKGKGRLYNHVGRIIEDLVEDGTVKAGAQPIVIVVQEIPSPPWAFHDDD